MGVKSKLWKKILIRMLLYPLALYVGVTVLLLLLEGRMVFHPSPYWRALPADVDVKEVTIPMKDGTRIHARWLPCPDAKGAVLLCQGNGSTLSQYLQKEGIQLWHQELGESLFIFDYPGYGKSEGEPTEASCHEAAEAAYRWLVDRQEVPPERVILFGQSLGTAMAVDVASRNPHRMLVLLSPFTSIPDVGQRVFPLLPARLLNRHQFNSLEKISKCTAPIFIAHGTKDHLVPFDLGKQLHEAAPAPKRFHALEGLGHDDSAAPMFPELRKFLDETDRR